MTNLADIPDIDRLLRDEPKAAFDAILNHLIDRLLYSMDRQQVGAVTIAMRVAFSLGERHGYAALGFKPRSQNDGTNP